MEYGVDYRNWLVHSSLRSSIYPFIHHTFVVSLHFQTNCSGVDLKLGRYIHYSTPQGWLIFGHILLWTKFCTYLDKVLWGLISNLVDTFVMVIHSPDKLLVTLHWILAIWLASDLSSSFRAFADKLLIRLSSDMVAQLLTLPHPPPHLQAWLTLVMFCWISTISWLLIGGTVSKHLQKNCWYDWPTHHGPLCPESLFSHALIRSAKISPALIKKPMGVGVGGVGWGVVGLASTDALLSYKQGSFCVCAQPMRDNITM